jgi:hypothetical protein
LGAEGDVGGFGNHGVWHPLAGKVG